MSVDPLPKKNERSEGVNETEQYLSMLCKRSFLSIWSWSNVYFAPAKELADLLVVCGNDIIIFQDKRSEFPDSGDLLQDWNKWHRRTVLKGSEQVWGAYRRILLDPTRLFLDPQCTKRLPIPFPEIEQARFHLVVVAHGASQKCADFYGGSGSFILRSGKRDAAINLKDVPHDLFTLYDTDPERPYVHVLDDTSLENLMSSLDTITDFTSYLRKKEGLFRSGRELYITGEEELLADYLTNVNDAGEHDFDLGLKKNPDITGVLLVEGAWDEFSQNPQRLAQLEQDKISYMWDDLIESFSHHAMQGTQYVIPEMTTAGVEGMERIVRFMAQEPRFMRRLFASSLKDILLNTPDHLRKLRVMRSRNLDGVYYVLLLFPIPKDFPSTYDGYRRARSAFLQGTCTVVKLKYPEAKHIIGIATETGFANDGRSEDAMYLDATEWSEEQQQAAREFQEKFEVLVNPTEVPVHVSEYPDVPTKEEFVKNPRNKLCPCGSEKKYKKCCEPKGRKFYK